MRVIATVIVGAVIGAAVVGIVWWSTDRNSHTTNPAAPSWIAKRHVQPDNGMSSNCGYVVNANHSGGIIVCGLNGDYVCFRPDPSDLSSTESWLPAGDCPNGARDALLQAHILDPAH